MTCRHGVPWYACTHDCPNPADPVRASRRRRTLALAGLVLAVAAVLLVGVTR